jgi:hypothetical protein
MANPSRSLLQSGSWFLCVLIPIESTMAHPPFAPYDDTRFAAITSFGPSVGVEVATDGLIAPLKGVNRSRAAKPSLQSSISQAPYGLST